MASGQEARRIAKCLQQCLHQVALLHTTVKMQQLLLFALRQLGPSGAQGLGVTSIEEGLVAFGIIRLLALHRQPQRLHPLRVVDGVAELASEGFLVQLSARPEQYPPCLPVLALDNFGNGVTLATFLGILCFRDHQSACAHACVRVKQLPTVFVLQCSRHRVPTFGYASCSAC